MAMAFKLKQREVPKQLRGDYTGRKFNFYCVEEVIIPSDNNVWSGGSRESYRAVRLIDGAEIPLGSDEAPWSPDRKDTVIKLVSGIVVVRHSWFCGVDSGLTFYVHPSNVAPFLKG